MLCAPVLLVTLAAAPVDDQTLRLHAPTTDALMMLARNAGVNLYAAPLPGTIDGDFDARSQDALVREVLGKVTSEVHRREGYVFVGKPAASKGFPRFTLGAPAPKIRFLWERDISAGDLARVLALTLNRQVIVSPPYDQERLTVVLTNVAADEAVAALAFFVGQPVDVTEDGVIAIGEAKTAVTRDCVGFRLSPSARISAYSPAVYPFALLTNDGVSCATDTGRTVRTGDGTLLRVLGPDDEPGSMLYRIESGANSGGFVKVGFDGYEEARPCLEITRDARLVKVNRAQTAAVLSQGLIQCTVARYSMAGEFKIMDIDRDGPYVFNHSKNAKNAVVQVTRQGIAATIDK